MIIQFQTREENKACHFQIVLWKLRGEELGDIVNVADALITIAMWDAIKNWQRVIGDEQVGELGNPITESVAEETVYQTVRFCAGTVTAKPCRKQQISV